MKDWTQKRVRHKNCRTRRISMDVQIQKCSAKACVKLDQSILVGNQCRYGMVTSERGTWSARVRLQNWQLNESFEVDI